MKTRKKTHKTSHKQCHKCQRVEYVEVTSRDVPLQSTGWKTFVEGLFHVSECPECRRKQETS